MLRADSLVKRFGDGSTAVTALGGVSVVLEQGQRLGLTGPSGCGKSTLASCLSLLRAPDGGTVTIDEQVVTAYGIRAPRDMRRTVQLLWQSPRSAADPRQTVRQIMAEPSELDGRSGTDTVQRWAPVVGVAEELLDRHPHEVSEGQLQRAMIGRALACEPRYLIADEPTSMLDVSSQASVLQALSAAQEETGLGVLLITHDTSLAAHWCTDVVSFASLSNV